MVSPEVVGQALPDATRVKWLASFRQAQPDLLVYVRHSLTYWCMSGTALLS